MSLYLRKALLSDADLLFEWANDPLTRQNAFNSKIIKFEEHVAWYRKILNDPSEAQYILMSDEQPIGQIRLSINDKEAEIDYSVYNAARGKGNGKNIIRLIINQVKNDYPAVHKLVGLVKPDNNASYYCFLKNGFEEKYRRMELFLIN